MDSQQAQSWGDTFNSTPSCTLQSKKVFPCPYIWWMGEGASLSKHTIDMKGKMPKCKSLTWKAFNSIHKQAEEVSSQSLTSLQLSLFFWCSSFSFLSSCFSLIQLLISPRTSWPTSTYAAAIFPPPSCTFSNTYSLYFFLYLSHCGCLGILYSFITVSVMVQMSREKNPWLPFPLSVSPSRSLISLLLELVILPLLSSTILSKCISDGLC